MYGGLELQEFGKKKTPDPNTQHVTIAVSGYDGGKTIDFRKFANQGMSLVGLTKNYENGKLYFENDLKIKGEFREYAYQKMLENQKSYLKDLEQSIDDFEKTGGKKVWMNQVGVNTPEMEKETWEMGKEKFEENVQEARDFIREKKRLVEDAEKQLQGTQ